MADEPECAGVEPAEDQVAATAVDKAQKIFFVKRKVRYYGAEAIVPVFADLAAVRHSEHVFQLMFFQAVLPITEEAQDLVNLQEVPARCIARIVLPPELMSDLYKAMESNMAKREKLLE